MSAAAPATIGDTDADAPSRDRQALVDRARRALRGGDDAALFALDDELGALAGQRGPGTARALPLLALYRSLVRWRRDGEFVPPFETVQAAQIQIWELDGHCPDLAYQRRFADHAAARYGKMRGFQMFGRVLATIGTSRSTFQSDRAQDVQVYRRAGAALTILGLSGNNDRYSGLGWTLFDRAVAEPLNANLIVLRDHNKRLYLAGLRSLGDYRTSVAGVRELLAEFADTRIVATGGSAGVFGAINVASDLGIRHVVAFSGPTSIEVGEESEDRQIYRNVAADIAAGRIERVDLAAKLNAGAVERVDFFVAGGHDFDMAQMEALRSRTDRLVPHIYRELSGHIITDYAIADGSIFAAFRAGPQATGLA